MSRLNRREDNPRFFIKEDRLVVVVNTGSSSEEIGKVPETRKSKE